MERIPQTGLLSFPDIQTYSMEKCFSSSSSVSGYRRCRLGGILSSHATRLRGLETSPQSTFTKWWIVNDWNINFG